MMDLTDRECLGSLYGSIQTNTKHALRACIYCNCNLYPMTVFVVCILLSLCIHGYFGFVIVWWKRHISDVENPFFFEVRVNENVWCKVKSALYVGYYYYICARCVPSCCLCRGTATATFVDILPLLYIIIN